MLDLLVYVLPFFSSPWLSPLLSVTASSLPLLLPFYPSASSSFQPRSREFAISPDLCITPSQVCKWHINIICVLGRRFVCSWVRDREICALPRGNQARIQLGLCCLPWQRTACSWYVHCLSSISHLQRSERCWNWSQSQLKKIPFPQRTL